MSLQSAAGWQNLYNATLTHRRVVQTSRGCRTEPGSRRQPMPQWKVEGANDQTGADMSLIISAADKDTAIRIAQRRGMYVSKVGEHFDPGVPAAEATLAAGRSASTRLGYAVPDSRAVPSYQGLMIASSLLTAFAILGYLLGSFALVGGL